MAIREIQTAGARIMYLVQPTDRDVSSLLDQLHLHPHDAEALLAIQTKNQLQPFRDDTLIQLRWPNYTASDKQLQAAEITLIVGPNRLIISDRSGLAPIESLVDSLMIPNGARWLDRPESVMATLILELARWTESQARAFQADVVTTIGDRDRQNYVLGLSELVTTLSAYQDLKVSQLESEAVTILQLALHRLRHQAVMLRNSTRAVARSDNAQLKIQSLPKVATGYAWASAVMVMVMLGWMMVKV